MDNYHTFQILCKIDGKQNYVSVTLVDGEPLTPLLLHEKFRQAFMLIEDMKRGR